MASAHKPSLPGAIKAADGFRYYRWKPLCKPELGLGNWLSESIRAAEVTQPGSLPNLRGTKSIFIGSDYGGQHEGAAYYSTAILLAGREACATWDISRREVRARCLPDGRRLSYKNLGDRVKLRALAPFLECANTIPGLLVAFLIDRHLGSLFSSNRRFADPDSLGLTQYSHWDPEVFERLLRLVHLVSVLLAGLSGGGQDVVWISDEDDIAANRSRFEDFGRILSDMSSHYVDHQLRVTVGTTNIDRRDRRLEDFVAIPDLVAGALQDTAAMYASTGPYPIGEFTLAPVEGLAPKTRRIMNWFADEQQPLKRLVYVLDQAKNPVGTSLTRLSFLGARAPASVPHEYRDT